MTSDAGGGDANPRPRASVRLGRRIYVIALVVYTLLLCAAAVRSWWPAIFWPSPSADAASAYRDVRCADGLVELRGMLDAELVRTARRQVPKDPGFWEDWDDRHAALTTACERAGADPADAHASLYRLRHRYRAFITRFDDDVTPLARETDERIERALDARPTSHATLAPISGGVTSNIGPAAAGETNGQDL